MKRFFLFLSFSLILGADIAVPQINKNKLKNEANSRRVEQQRKEAQERERERNLYDYIVDDWDLEEYNNFVREYPRSNYAKEIRDRIEELNLWNKAWNTGTVNSLQNYIDSTKYGRFTSRATERIQQLQAAEINAAWNKAKNDNTREAYEGFVRKYPQSDLVEEANAKIRKLLENEAWANVENSSSPQVLQKFIQDFPESSRVPQAKKKLTLIAAVDFFKQGKYEKSYKEFSKLSLAQIPSQYLDMYNKVKEEAEFEGLSSSSKPEALQNFLRSYPTSPYCDKVKNYLALSLANRFGVNSTQYDYDRALSYAVDVPTKDEVERLIKGNKNYVKEYNKRLKAETKKNQKASKKDNPDRLRALEARKNNGGLIRMGFEFMDMALNYKEGDELILRYDLAWKLIVGNNSDRLQAAAGLKFGLLFTDMEEHNSAEIYGETALDLEAKLNLFKVSDVGWWFLNGGYRYNFARPKDMIRPMSWSVGTGFASKNWDFSLYYQKEFGNMSDPDFVYYEPKPNFFVGFVLGWSFRIW